MYFMENIKWELLTINEIKLKQLTLNESYEAKKNKIVKLLDELRELEREYHKGQMEINKRLGKK